MPNSEYTIVYPSDQGVGIHPMLGRSQRVIVTGDSALNGFLDAFMRGDSSLTRVYIEKHS